MIVLLIILKIVVYLLLCILGLLLTLLIVPLNYSGRLLAADGFKAQLSLGWAWKLLGINAELEGEAVDVSLKVFGRRVYKLKSGERAEKKEQGGEEQEKKQKEKKPGRGIGIKDIANKALLNEILEYVKKVLDIAKPKYFHLYGTYGFEDPSLTGMICGATGMIRSLIPNARLSLTPDFSQEIFDLDMRAEGSMTVGSLVWQTLRTALKRPVRRVLFKRNKN